MKATVDLKENNLVVGREWNSLVYFDLGKKSKFCVMETLDNDTFYDHCCLPYNRVLLGTVNGVIKLLEYDPKIRKSWIIFEKKFPILKKKEELTAENIGLMGVRGGNYGDTEQISRVSVCPKFKIAAFHFWNRNSIGYFCSSITFVELRKKKIIFKLKYILQNFKVPLEFLKENQKEHEGRLKFFQAFGIQGYKKDTLFLCGISFRRPTLLFTFGYQTRFNKIICRRVENIEANGSVLQMKVFDKELFTVDSAGSVFNLG